MIDDATGSRMKVLQGFVGHGVETVLDVGCGPGDKTARIARRSVLTVGIDPEADQIRAARERHGSRHLQFGVARAEMLCFAAALFDAVFFNESLHHVPAEGQQTALREGHRVLKPRGRMLIIEPIHGSGTLGRTLRLYLDEKPQERNAVEAIDAVLTTEFELKDRAEIKILYGFTNFEDFYGFFVMSEPEAKRDKIHKNDLRARFERCRRTPQGGTVVDYAASVWHLLKR